MRRQKPGATCRTGPEFVCWVFDEFWKLPLHFGKSLYKSRACKAEFTCWVFDGADPMHPTLFTLGYEGLTIEAFIARLQAAQVKTVVDVRELPLSRKKGFSKSAFCAALSAHGIAYLHAPALGCPKPIRNQYKADGN